MTPQPLTPPGDDRLRSARRGRHWLGLAILLTALGTYYFDYPRDLQNHAHWAKVSWVPFESRPVLLRDTVLNVLLFVPFGMVTRLRLPHRAGLCMLLGLALSLLGEGTQVFSHGRVPSMTDVICNVIGTAAGVMALRVVGR